MTGRRIRVTTEIYTVKGGSTEYHEVPAGWDGWTPDERESYRDQLFADALAEVAGGGVTLVDGDDRELNDDGTRA